MLKDEYFVISVFREYVGGKYIQLLIKVQVLDIAPILFFRKL